MNFLIVDDHALIRSGLSDVLTRNFPDSTCVSAANNAEALSYLNERPIDLAIVDLFIPGEDTFSHIRKICDSFPELPVVVLSAHEDPTYIRKCVDFGVSAFVPKSAPEHVLITAITTAAEGGFFVPKTQNNVVNISSFHSADDLPAITLEIVSEKLTERQVHILTLVSQGKTNKQIARECNLSDNTVKVHVSNILRGLGLSNRTQAGLLGQKLGLMQTK